VTCKGFFLLSLQHLTSEQVVGSSTESSGPGVLKSYFKMFGVAFFISKLTLDYGSGGGEFPRTFGAGRINACNVSFRRVLGLVQ
jgi:hypothetical protein